MIREFKKEDFLDIYKIGNAYKNNFSKTYDLNFYLSNSNFIVLVSEEELVNAFLIVSKSFNEYSIEMVVVDKNYRNKGIASKMIKYLIDNYLSKDDKIILEVASNNEYAIKLYKKFGFEIKNIRSKYYIDVDAYIMERVV